MSNPTPARIVTITDTGDGRILVQSPFNADLPPQARALGGRWIPTRRGWSFDARDRQRVQDLHQQIFGDSGADNTTGINVVTLRVTIASDWGSEDRASLVIAGRPVASASGRDSGARLGSGVVLLAGRVRSGGSRANWRTIAAAGTVLLVRDVGAAAAQAAIDAAPNGVTISIDHQDDDTQDDTQADSTDVTAPAVVDLAALQAQRAQLVAQIAQIDAALAAATTTTQGDN